MTAIVAFAQTDCVFIGGDTKRSVAFLPAQKVHSWSDRTLFGQAGNALHLSEAIGICFKSQSAYGGGLDGLLDAFDQARKAVYPKALPSNPNGASGTLLIAHSGDVNHSAGLWKMEFDPAIAPVQMPGSIAAIGVAGIHGAAQQHWPNADPSGSISLARWAMSAIDSVVGPDVNWPIDVMISKPASVPAERLVICQRLNAARNTPDPLFDWP